MHTHGDQALCFRIDGLASASGDNRSCRSYYIIILDALAPEAAYTKIQ